MEGKAAPRPVFGMIDPFPFQRIQVHVAELFDSLLQTPHIEILETALPEARERVVARCKYQIQLCGGRSFFAPQSARDALLQNLNHSGRHSFDRLADEQRNVIGHNYIAHQREPVAVARLAENLDEGDSGANRAQKRQASIAGEGDEMQMAARVETNEFVSHGTKEKSKPRPFKLERVGHPETLIPERQDQFLGVDVLEWYHPIVSVRQQKKYERVGHRLVVRPSGSVIETKSPVS